MIDTIHSVANLTQWAKAVKSIDGFRCVACGKKSEEAWRLEAHHIIPVHIDDSKALVLENGVTLCFRCHSYITWSPKEDSNRLLIQDKITEYTKARVISDSMLKEIVPQLFKPDHINLTVPKGKKEQIRSHSAKKDGGSINAFINRAIDETMQRDNEKPGE